MQKVISLAILSLAFIAPAFAEPLDAPQNVRASTYATSDNKPGWVRLSWDGVTSATSYEVWGKISDPAVLGFLQGTYTGYQYYPAFGEARQRFVRIGTTTGTTLDVLATKESYSCYNAYTEYNEYSPYGCYRIVALSTTLPVGGATFDVSPHRGLPSAEAHPVINSNDLYQPSYVTLQPHSSAGVAILRWDSSAGATHYEVYRKRQRRFVGVFAGAAGGHGAAVNLVDVDWRHDANEGSAFHPYSAYGAYNSFLVSAPYVEYMFQGATTGTNMEFVYALMPGLGAYHEYSSYGTYGTYNSYSNYTEYGVFKVVAINMSTTRRSPASSESIRYNPTSSGDPVGSTSSSGTCFLSATRRNARD